jgi:isopenicillin-N epimerase
MAARDEWDLDPDWLTVNHGSYGATPKSVLAAQALWRARMERQPTRFMTLELPGAIRHAASCLAAFLGVAAADLAFLDNATTGCNAVIRSLRLAEGDEIVMLSHGYNAVRNTMRFVAERAGATFIEAAVPFPHADDAALVACLEAVLTPRTRLVVLDHITSPTALILPLPQMIAACQARGIPVLVDGAHAPGQVPLDLPALGADWYTGNCHKWMMAAKGCAFLWARPDRQSGLHPVTISHGLGGGFIAEFDWTGTRDPSAYLSVEAAIDFHTRMGGPALMARNADLAGKAAARIADRLGSFSVHSPGCAMAVIRVDLPGPATREHAMALRAHLFAARTDLPLSAQDGQFWLRISAQAYNDMADFDRLADIIETVLPFTVR